MQHKQHSIDNILIVKLRIDQDITGFQDLNIDKTITLTNTQSKATIRISYTSLKYELYFFIDSSNSKTISIVDQFAGQNFYDYNTLQLLNKENCFKEFGGCGGFSVSSFIALGKPFLIFDETGWH